MVRQQTVESKQRTLTLDLSFTVELNKQMNVTSRLLTEPVSEALLDGKRPQACLQRRARRSGRRVEEATLAISQKSASVLTVHLEFSNFP